MVKMGMSWERTSGKGHREGRKEKGKRGRGETGCEDWMQGK